MSKSFRILNGDLALTGDRTFDIVSGRDKLIQDLTLWVLERIGSDPLTPTFGSTLDGGIINGAEVPSFIGEVMTQGRINEIRAEVNNLLNQYQQLQLAKIQAETVQYGGSTTLDPDEVLKSIDSITTATSGTIIIVRVALTTLGNSQLQLTIPIQNG